MRHVTLALLALAVMTGCGGTEGDTCEPFPNAAEKVYAGCSDELVCVGTAGNGRCARPDQPSDPDATPGVGASAMGGVKAR